MNTSVLPRRMTAVTVAVLVGVVLGTIAFPGLGAVIAGMSYAIPGIRRTRWSAITVGVAGLVSLGVSVLLVIGVFGPIGVGSAFTDDPPVG
ncbi:hypothetical protein [Curtobacterium sp. RRHDQ10]|uniref:hypothetical protein n=1 Tax=Curtobacterium phyllosphaerae TaxID=3413379 RepID=UPI003BF0CF2C